MQNRRNPIPSDILPTFQAKTLFASAPMTGDADDLYADEASGKIYVSGGQGAISIFQKQGNGGYKQTASLLIYTIKD